MGAPGVPYRVGKGECRNWVMVVNGAKTGVYGESGLNGGMKLGDGKKELTHILIPLSSKKSLYGRSVAR